MLKDKMEARERNGIYMIQVQPTCLRPRHKTFNSYIFLLLSTVCYNEPIDK